MGQYRMLNREKMLALAFAQSKIFAMLGLVLLLLLAACGQPASQGAGASAPSPSSSNSSSSAPPTAKQPAEAGITSPVTLKVADGLFTEEEWQTIIVKMISTKYPNITLERTSGKLEDLVAAGQSPDIIFQPISSTANLMALDLPLDLSPLIKQHNVDLNKIEPVVVDALHKFSGSQGVVAMPLYVNVQALLYNKDIFDKFGVPYPKDSMTYDQLLDLVRKLTRTEGGVNYMGYLPLTWTAGAGQLSLATIDNKTNKALVGTLEGYKTVFQFHKDLFAIPGMKPGNKNIFYKDHTVAMQPDWLQSIFKSASSLQGMNWDMVAIPVFKERPGIHSETDFHAAFVSKASKQQEAAFLVVNYLSTSTEVQTVLTKEGHVPVLTDPQVKKQWAADAGFMSGKHKEIILESHMAPVRDIHPLDRDANVVIKPMGDAYNAVIGGQKDINSALRDAAEAINEAVAAKMSK
ncbi:MAG: transporter substrate-binding protein [Paenibacillaceae bacterium]|jgi:multiple sugar transport system substrate-binding protein|nr:transporter substrate-binding protein [Paenibacillaceae bacterium]